MKKVRYVPCHIKESSRPISRQEIERRIVKVTSEEIRFNTGDRITFKGHEEGSYADFYALPTIERKHLFKENITFAQSVIPDEYGFCFGDANWKGFVPCYGSKPSSTVDIYFNNTCVLKDIPCW